MQRGDKNTDGQWARYIELPRGWWILISKQRDPISTQRWGWFRFRTYDKVLYIRLGRHIEFSIFRSSLR